LQVPQSYSFESVGTGQPLTYVTKSEKESQINYAMMYMTDLVI